MSIADRRNSLRKSFIGVDSIRKSVTSLGEGLTAIGNKSRELLIQSDKKEINKDEIRDSSECIFIVGMPRSGSTLLESILSMKNDVSVSYTHLRAHETV